MADAPPDCRSYYERLHEECGEVLTASFAPDLGELQARSHDAIAGLEVWLEVLPSNDIKTAVRGVVQEYQLGLLTLAQGFYRHSFASLRYCLELTLGCVYLSTNELHLRLWLLGEYDVSWTNLLDRDKGVFSATFSRAFSPFLAEEMPHYGTIASKVYRECSEYVHGNPSTSTALPSTIGFSEPLFRAWHTHAESVRLVQHFALAARFLNSLSGSQLVRLELVLRDVLGHLPQIRAVLEPDVEPKR